MYKPTITLIALAAFGTAACGDDSDQSVTINFAAKVGAEDFVCGDSYDLGMNATTLAISDFRFYVSEVELRNADGVYVPVELDTNNFQVFDVALLDFEDNCTSELGTAEVNSTVTGAIESGDYDSIRFTMGVPFELNHENPAVALPPLNIGSMNWNWQVGYKFLRIDSTGMPVWRMHLGSTGCDGTMTDGGTTMCPNENRVSVELTDFDIATDTVVADLAALTDGAPIDQEQGVDPGCQSKPPDMDCAPLFSNLGLPFGGTPGGTQSFFRAE